MFENLIYLNFGTVSTAVIALIFLKFNVTLDNRSTKIFKRALYLVLLLSLTDSIYWYYWDTKQSTLLEEICANIGYILRPTILFLIANVIHKNKQKSYWIYVPLTLNTIILLQNYATHNVFYFLEDNSFKHGIFGYTPHIVSAIYSIWILWAAIKYFQLSSVVEMITIVSCIFTTVIATYYESIHDMWGLIRQSIVMCIVFYMLQSHISASNRDILTKAYNRVAFTNDVGKYHNRIYAVVSIDLNDLKKHNDLHGHSEGDKALVKVAEVFARILPPTVRIYRTGGDEFVFLAMKKPTKSMENLVNDIRTELSKTKYRCSFGIAYLSEFDSFDDAYDYADVLMYKNKSAMKQGLNDSDMAELPKEVHGR